MRREIFDDKEKREEDTSQQPSDRQSERKGS